MLDHGAGVAGGGLVGDRYRFRFRLPGFGGVLRGAFGLAAFGFGFGFRVAELEEDFGERPAPAVEGLGELVTRDVAAEEGRFRFRRRAFAALTAA